MKDKNINESHELLRNNKARTSMAFRKYGWFIHVVAWGVLCVFPVVLSLSNNTEQRVSWDFYVRFLMMLTSIIIVFYINYLFWVDKYLFTKKTGVFLLINLALVVGMVIITHLCMELLPSPPERPPHPDRPPKGLIRLGIFFWNSMTYIFVIALSVAFRSTISWYRVEAQRRELEQSRSEAELQNLKSQLNPHFLFNTLNNIYSLIAFSPEKAQEAVHELSRLLRYVMHDSSQSYVLLEKELDFIRNYVELMRIRLPEQVQVETFISVETSQAEVAPLLFISLIENAFKHGVSTSKPSYIGLDIRQVGNEVVCVIINSYFPKDVDKDKSGSGIGLSNLRKRLELLYPGRHELHCGREGESYRAYLSLTINN